LKDHFRNTIVTIESFISKVVVNPIENETIKEIMVRLARLETEYGELMTLTKSIQDSSPHKMEMSFDQESGVMTILVDGKPVQQFKLHSADPNVPVTQYGPSFSANGYHAGKVENGESDELYELKAQMESRLEVFYQNAHRVLMLVNSLTCAKRIKAKGITMVRNKLIEHPPKGALYTFGWSDKGPLVKPIRRGELDWTDKGLEPNTSEFLDEITRCFSVKADSFGK
jgi:hypothetical protein